MSERRLAILIASSQFPNEPELEDLRCPENDVDGLNEVLSSKDRGDFAETIVLKNEPHHEVLKIINRILKQAQKNDLVLMFYSGHGRLDLAGRLYLATVDTEIETLEATSIPVNNIKDYIDFSPSKKSVFLLDCCYSGAVKKSFFKGSIEEQVQQQLQSRGTFIMTASTELQLAEEKESDKYGVFTKHIIKGIRTGAADLNDDGLIGMNELYSYVHDRVLEECSQRPTKSDLEVRGELFIARSGKTPREERRKQIREILGELWTTGILPEDILDEARKVSALNPEQISGELRVYDDLLDQLIQKKIEVGEFISKWYKVGSKPPISISEKPALKPTAPKPDKSEPGKIKPFEPKPDATATTEPKSPEPRKTSNALKFGAVAGVIVLLIIGILWWFSQQQVREVRQAMDQLVRQVLNLENAVAKFDKPEQLDELYRQRDALSHQVAGISERATKVGFRSQLEELQNRLKQVQIQLAKRYSKIVIGINAPLSGEFRLVGKGTKFVAQMWLEDINAVGGLQVGNKKFPVQLVIEDNASKAELAVKANTKMINEDKVLAIVGPQSSRQAVPAGGKANELSTPLISPWSTNPNTTKGRPYVFRGCFLDPFQGPVVANFIKNEFGFTKAAVLYDVASDYPTGLAESFKKAWEDLNGSGSVVAYVSFITKNTDFSSQLTKINSSGAEFLFTPQFYNEVALIVQQAHQLGWDKPIVGSDSWESAVKLCGKDCYGLFFSTHYAAAGAKGATKEFINRYRQKHESVPDDAGALTWDSMRIIQKAIQDCGNLTGDIKKDRQCVRDALARIKQFQGITGNVEYFTEDGDPIKCATIVKISNYGEFEFYTSICPFWDSKIHNDQ